MIFNKFKEQYLLMIVKSATYLDKLLEIMYRPTDAASLGVVRSLFGKLQFWFFFILDISSNLDINFLIFTS